jgi:Leucine-rich repeat (LRR) protein
MALQWLSLGYNNMTSVPAELGRAVQVGPRLIVHCCSACSLNMRNRYKGQGESLVPPDTRGSVSLSLRGTTFQLCFQFQLAPLQLANLTALLELELSFNQLTSVPPELGKEVQVEPMKPVSKPPRHTRWKQSNGFSNYPFKFKLRR